MGQFNVAFAFLKKKNSSEIQRKALKNGKMPKMRQKLFLL
jgi:hypothetical protein